MTALNSLNDTNDAPHFAPSELIELGEVGTDTHAPANPGVPDAGYAS